MEFEKCFIMHCTNRTEQECLDRNLFGDHAWKLDYLREIKPGDMGLLFNLDTNEIIGIFQARSEVQSDIEPDAWDGRFPAQVRVEPMGEIQRIPSARNVFSRIGIEMTRWSKGALVPRFQVYDRNIALKFLAHFREPISGRKGKISHAERGSIGFPSSPKLKFNDVIGLEDVKDFIQKRMVDPVKELELAQKYYIRLGGGLLLYGPPGTGKTLVAEATAGEIDAPIVEISPSIIRGFPGDPEKKIE